MRPGMTVGALPTTVRLGLFYAALFSVIGVQLPFWPLYLSSKGLDAAEIGVAIAATYLVRLASNPLVGAMADRIDQRRRPLMLLALAGAATTACFSLVSGFWAVLGITVLSFAATTAMLPLADNLSLLCVTRQRLDYGRIRLWGSLAFIAVSALGGLFLIGAPPFAILWASVGANLLCWAVAMVLPEIHAKGDGKSGPRPFGRLLTNRIFCLFLGATGFIQLSHVIYYGFATLHWRAAGLSGGTIGALWAEGVIAEVILFAFGARLLVKLGPAGLIAAGAGAGIVRWTVLALTTDPALLAIVQVLHAFTFAATHLGAMHFVNRSVPAEMSAASMGLYASVTMGVIPGLALLGAGHLYQELGGAAFLTMSAAAAIGLALAATLRRHWRGGPILSKPGCSSASHLSRRDGPQG